MTPAALSLASFRLSVASPQVLRLQALLDASSRVRNTLCVLCTLGLGAWMALNNTVSLGTCYSFFVFSFRQGSVEHLA